MEGAVCPGVDVVYNCTTDGALVRWTAEPYFTRFTRVQFTPTKSDNLVPSLLQQCLIFLSQPPSLYLPVMISTSLKLSVLLKMV